MCGIVGCVRFDEGKVSEQLIKSMTDVIAHRGPDGVGCWINSNQNVSLGHRRLSIIDLSNHAHQPMNVEGRYTIVFNGEIYNYLELRKSLVSDGTIFRTNSDTEVLVQMYHRYGAKMLDQLDGMEKSHFSIVIARTNTFILEAN
jgi:asparagine synthase (glutamine-hydrolysing)